MSNAECHNEVQYPCARLLVKRAFSEPLGEGWFTTMCKPSPEALGQKPQDILGCVHVLSASWDANRKDTPVKLWSSETVAEWVRTVLPEGGDTTKFVSNLVEEEVSGSELVSVGDAHLKAMGLTKIGHCLKLLNAIKALK